MDPTITAERALTPGGWRHRVRLTVRDGVIVDVGDIGPGHTAEFAVLAPGFVDLQVNGFDDVDVGAAVDDDWGRLGRALAAQGTTAWCPTLTTRPLDAYTTALARAAAAAGAPPEGARIVGVHLEGPFLGTAHGAHASRSVIEADHSFVGSLPPIVRMVTLGAEIEGAVDLVRALAERGVLVAIGHSRPTDAQIDAAVGAGARLVTHVFNAMSGVHHRGDGGLALAALTDDRLALSLVADGVHVSPRALRLVWRARPDAVVLVTDAVAWRAHGDRLAITDGAPRLADGTIAGSCLTMDEAVRRSVEAGASLADALAAASARPAGLLGLTDRGVIDIGRRADLVALDHSLQVVSTWVAGRPVHRRASR